MIEFTYTHENGEDIRVMSYNNDLNIYEIGELFSRFLAAVGFHKDNIRDLFGLEEDEELPTG